MNLRRIFLYLLIVSVAFSALIGIGVIVFGDFGELEIRVLLTTLTVTVTSIFGLACGAYLESGRGRTLPTGGIAASVIAALMCFLIIWNVLDDSETFIKLFLTATLIAGACSHLSLISLASLDRRFAWSRGAAFVLDASLTVLLLYLMWFEPEGDDLTVYRVIGTLAILIAALTVVTPVFHKLSTSGPSLRDIDSEIESLKSKIGELEKQRAELQAADQDI